MNNFFYKAGEIIMKSFFDKFEKEQKFNLFIGDFLNKISGYPTRVDISEAILSEIKSSAKNYIKDLNSFSDIVQAYLDAVIDTKKNLVKQIKENFEYRYNTNLEVYNNIINSRYFDTVFTLNFDTILESNFSSIVNKITPYEIKENTEEKINYYKFFGDITNVGTVFISSQDIRKLKTLEFYNPFFKKVREEFKTKPTLFLGVNLEDSDLLNTLDFVLSPIKDLQNIYMVASTTIISTKATDFINKYNIKLITSDTIEFINYFKEISESENTILPEKKFVW